MIRSLTSTFVASLRSFENKFQKIRTIKAIYESVPSSSPTKFENLTVGAHIMLSKSVEDHDQAIVTDINKNSRTLTVIRCICKDKNTPLSKAEIKEEDIKFQDRKQVLLVNYRENVRNNTKIKFTRMPEMASVEVARYFKDNMSSFEIYHPNLMKDCEHFAFCCTLGYPINQQEMNLLMFAIAALKMINKKSENPVMKYLMESEHKLAKYDKGKDQITITSQQGEVANIPFAC